MSYVVVRGTGSRSFPVSHAFLDGAAPEGDVIVYLSGSRYVADQTKTAILIELDLECLGVHTGEASGEEGSNVLGFARYRNGDADPTNLIELVRQPRTSATALAAAKQLFEEAGFSVAVCADQPGRIVDRLVRPKYNAALRFLDEGLASAADMDTTCRLGLGYPDGPIERVVRGDLARHYQITSMLFEVTGQAGYAPARRSVVAHARRMAGSAARSE